MESRTSRQGVPDENRWGICGPFMIHLPISGAVISVVDRSGHRSAVATTDPVATRWDELELELGAGPLLDATADSVPQLVADVSTATMNPVVGAQLEELGIRALFTFPLLLGSATVGVAGLYRTTVGALSSESLSEALLLARSATIPAVREALRLAAQESDDDDSLDTGPGLRREVHQATGMLSAQLDVTTTEAFARLRAHAISSGRSVTAVSMDVVNGLLSFLDLDLERG